MLTSQNMVTLIELGPAKTASETVSRQFSRVYLEEKENYYQERLVVNSQHGSKTSFLFQWPCRRCVNSQFPSGWRNYKHHGGWPHIFIFSLWVFAFLSFSFAPCLFKRLFLLWPHTHTHTHTHISTHTNSKWFVKVIHGSNPPKLTPHHPTGLKTHDFGTRPPLSGSVFCSHTGQEKQKMNKKSHTKYKRRYKATAWWENITVYVTQMEQSLITRLFSVFQPLSWSIKITEKAKAHK